MKGIGKILEGSVFWVYYKQIIVCMQIPYLYSLESSLWSYYFKLSSVIVVVFIIGVIYSYSKLLYPRRVLLVSAIQLAFITMILICVYFFIIVFLSAQPMAGICEYSCFNTCSAPKISGYTGLLYTLSCGGILSLLVAYIQTIVAARLSDKWKDIGATPALETGHHSSRDVELEVDTQKTVSKKKSIGRDNADTKKISDSVKIGDVTKYTPVQDHNLELKESDKNDLLFLLESVEAEEKSEIVMALDVHTATYTMPFRSQTMNEIKKPMENKSSANLRQQTLFGPKKSFTKVNTYFNQ